MKSRNQMKSLLILLCVILGSCLLAGGAMAANGAVATGACTNLANEGIEFFVPFGSDAPNSDSWRQHITVEVWNSSGQISGSKVIGVEMDTTNSSIRYQCEEVKEAANDEFSCNSMPINASIKGAYFKIKPNVSVDTNIVIWVYPNNYSSLEEAKAAHKVLLSAPGVVKYPPYPCARNFLYLKDFAAANGKELVYNVSTCDGNKTVEFVETPDQFAMVNLVPDDVLKAGKGNDPTTNRVRVQVTPKEIYSYKLKLTFADHTMTTTYDVTYVYDATAPDDPDKTYVDAKSLDGKTNDILPLTLLGGELFEIKAVKNDIWGNPDFPTNSDLDIKFWYENAEGTLGYENSVFHFERKLNIQFAPYCESADGEHTGVADTIYDTCLDKKQLFSADLTVTVVNDSGTYEEKGIIFTKSSGIPFFTEGTTPPDGEVPAHLFGIRKCLDSSCSAVAKTAAYLSSITVSDGGHKSRTYGTSGAHHKPGTTSIFKLHAYGVGDGSNAGDKPFSITGARLYVEEPGTYVIYAFLKDLKNGWKTDPVPDDAYAGKFYVTVPTNDSLMSCSSLANNGYFKAEWNDCLDPTLTQLMPFEHIPGTEEAWVRNTSAHGVHFPYVSEWSYVPQQLEVASLKCKFEALDASGRPGDGYCHPDDVYVPPHTKVTITGGTLYLAKSPAYDNYYVAYARRDTYNISHLFFSIYVKECKNVKKIPDTGISLRSPLKVNESVDAATSYVFTGNSLRIPAIGLGMETPIPIVHVYYEDGSVENGWDLSTLGNYVGELEGGTYLPYAGNSALTGHYYSMGVFKNLEGLNMGDEVIVYGNDGVKYIYKVVQKFIAQPSDVYEMFQQVGERSLTLVTCENYNLVTDEYERRTIVRAVIDSQDIYEEGIW